MSDPGQRVRGRTWPYAVGGAVLLFALVVIANVGDYEGGDAVVVLGPLAAGIGALIGAVLGRLINGHRTER